MKMKRRASLGKLWLVALGAFALWSASARAMNCARDENEAQEIAARVERETQDSQQNAPLSCCIPAKPSAPNGCAPDALKCAIPSLAAECCCAPTAPNSRPVLWIASPEMPPAIVAKIFAPVREVGAFSKAKSRGLLDVPRLRGATSPFAPRGPPVSA